MATHNPTTSKKLNDQAAAAALYVTDPSKQVRDVRKEANYPLDANGKLTSAGAATSLKHANARDLPSFPSVGIAQTAAGGAAGLAVQNTKSPEWWKPEASAGASKAALLANDYKMKPLWQPEASAAGSKAALLAHQKGPGLDLWEPSASDKALLAATGAAAGQKGTQHGKAPTSNETGLADRYPDEKNAAKNALKAATSVHKTGKYNDLPGLTDEEAENIRRQAMVKGMVGSMFGSNPLIGPELEERQHQEKLRQDAVALAQGMYGKRDQAYRDKISARAGSRAATSRGLDEDSDDEESPMSFVGLQAAAQKLANERLARLNDPDAAYREHYGTNPPQAKSRLSMFGGGSLRRKDSDEDMADEKRSRQIRGEMNLFQDKLKEIDARKRKDDRAALLAAAQRNVKALSAEMDEDVFQRTGKMSPAMKADWEAQARARAQADSEERNANFGKVKIGGGKYLDQTEIDAIARGRLQPTLDAISAKAAHDREIDEANRIAEEERKRIEQENKEQEKYNNMKTKEEWKKFKAEEKAEHEIEKQHQQEEKEAKKDAKMQDKFEHQKEKEHEQEIKAFEKEKEKQQKEEWKAFKEHEKEEERARKEEEKARKEENRQSKGSRFGSIFRRKSKKEKSAEKDEKPDAVLVPATAGSTTTTITAGEPAKTKAPVTKDAEHVGEPHHNPLTALENTPEAKAANQQKPGGDLIDVLKHKKEEHDAKKHHTADAAAGGAAAGAIAEGIHDHESELVGKDEPGKAQPSTGVPASEALAPEHEAPTTKSAVPISEPAPATSVSQAAPVAPVSESEPVDLVSEPAHAAPVTETAPVAAVSKAEYAAPAAEPAVVAPVTETTPAAPVAQTKPNDSSFNSQAVAARAVTAPETADKDIVPATTTTSTVTEPGVDRVEKPAEHDVGHESAPAPTVAPVVVASSAPAVVPSEVTSPTSPTEKFEDAVEAPVTAPVVAPSQEPIIAPVEKPAPIQHDTSAIDAPLTSETTKTASAPLANETSEIADAPLPTETVKTADAPESRSFALAPAPAAESNAPKTQTKAATPATAPVGPQSAGPIAVGGGEPIMAIGSDKPVTSEVNHSKVVDTLEPRVNVGKPGFTGNEKLAAATADMRGTDHAGASTSSATETANTSPDVSSARPAEATHAGGKVDAPIAERIAVPAEAIAAADAVDGKNAKHSSPSHGSEPKKQNRLSGFFKNKLGIKVKEHKGSDGVTVTPTTQYTTMGKYVDPNDKHAANKAAPIPSNGPILEQQSGGSSSAGAKADPEASDIAIDPAFREETRGRASGAKSEESDEARDTVAEQLQPPKPIGLPRASESPARETRFKEELSS